MSLNPFRVACGDFNGPNVENYATMATLKQSTDRVVIVVLCLWMLADIGCTMVASCW
jgi:hypothetical protein